MLTQAKKQYMHTYEHVIVAVHKHMCQDLELPAHTNSPELYPEYRHRNSLQMTFDGKKSNNEETKHSCNHNSSCY